MAMRMTEYDDGNDGSHFLKWVFVGDCQWEIFRNLSGDQAHFKRTSVYKKQSKSTVLSHRLIG